jgi:hypothetical protein
LAAFPSLSSWFLPDPKTWERNGTKEVSSMNDCKSRLPFSLSLTPRGVLFVLWPLRVEPPDARSAGTSLTSKESSLNKDSGCNLKHQLLATIKQVNQRPKKKKNIRSDSNLAQQKNKNKSPAYAKALALTKQPKSKKSKEHNTSDSQVVSYPSTKKA